jgi:hypothetical protein
MNNGSVGIGTKNPNAVLDISGFANTKGLVVTTNTSGGQNVFEANGAFGGLVVGNGGNVSMTTGCNAVNGPQSCIGVLEIYSAGGSFNRPNLLLRGNVSAASNLIDWEDMGGNKVGTLDKYGHIGIGTTSPWANISIHANNGDTNTTLFAIASSTAAATTTLWTPFKSLIVNKFFYKIRNLFPIPNTGL